jgi:hypothetical protein
MNKITISQSVKILTENDICQGKNEDLNSCDILTWIDKLFENHDERVFVQKELAREVGVLSHSLIRWNDSTKRREVADIFNRVVKRLQGA